MKIRQRKQRQHRSGKPFFTRRMRPVVSLTLSWVLGGSTAFLTGDYAFAQVAPGLPVACSGTACKSAGFDPLGAQLGVPKLGLGYNGNKLTITQGAGTAIFNWQSFNISTGNSVQFIQPSTNSVALNRIFDPNVTQINGNLSANGQIYLINPNGILFGSNAVVNVGGLIASTLNVSDSRITKGLLSDPVVTDPVFSSDPNIVGSALAASPGATPAITVQAGASLYAAGQDKTGTVVSAGRVFLFAPTVENAGSIKVDGGGQVILASGSNVYLGSSSDPSLRGLLVEVNGTEAKGVSVDASGSISVARGNITLMGLAVNQNGSVNATSALDANGSIVLVARQANPASTLIPTDPNVLITPGATGTVTLGSGSQTTVRLDPTDTATAPLTDATALALRSRIDIEGGSVNIGGNGAPGATLVEAHGGNVTVTARQAASGTDTKPYTIGDGSLVGGANGNAVINVGSDAKIDVSGLQNVVVDGARNFVYVDRLTSNNLANAPFQRTGFLFGQGVYLNLAQAPSWIDVSNLQAAVSGTQAERNATAGTIALRAEGAVNLAKGSVLDVSGGSIAYTAAIGRTSQLLTASGAQVDISNAQADTAYVGFADKGSTTVSDPTEGISQTQSWQVPHYTAVGGYVAGKNAGTVEIYAPNAHLGGTLLAQTTTAPEQRATPPLGGLLRIGSDDPTKLDTQAGFSRSSVVLENAAAYGSTATPAGTIALNADQLNTEGFSRLDITSDGSFTLAPGTTLNLGVGGSLTVRANAIAIDSSITAPGGSVSLSERPLTLVPLDNGAIDEANFRNFLNTVPAALRGSVSFAPGTQLDLAGLWTNDAVPVLTSAPVSPIALNGGSISVSGRSVDVSGASFDVSAGATLSSKGVFSGGQAGSLSLAGTYIPPGSSVLTHDSGSLNLGADFSSRIAGFGVSKGGSLSITAPSLVLAAAGAAAGPAGSLVIDTSVGNDGFQAFTFSATDSVSLAQGTSFVPVVQHFFNSSTLDQTGSAGELRTVTAPQALLAGQLAPTSITLSASSRADGTVTVGSGSTLEAGTQGSIFLAAGLTDQLNGTLRAQAGNVSLTLSGATIDDQTILTPVASRVVSLGSSAVIDVSGVSTAVTASNGIKSGAVLDAGNVTLNAQVGIVAMAPGATVLAHGASDTLDIPSGDHSYVRQTVTSQGGTVEISATNGLYLEGSFNAAGGGANASGGRLSVSDLAIYELANQQTSFGQDTALYDQLLKPHDMIIDGATLALPSGAASFPKFSGEARIASSLVNSSGFDQVWLQSADQISFAQSTSLAAKASLILSAPSLALAPGSAAGTTVKLAAPYVALGNVASLSSITPSWSNSPVALASGGTGSLQVNAGQIDLVGNFGLAGIGTTTLVSSGDVRAIGVTGVAGPRRSGTLSFGGNLNITAAQVYPSTQVDYTLQSVAASTDASSGTIDIAPAAGVSPLAPLSAGGTLTLNSRQINVEGDLVAPQGGITLNASQGIALAPGSVLSVAGSGLVPVGSVLSGNTWVYGVPQGGTIGPNVLASPSGTNVQSKSISLSAPNLLAQTGSTLDLAGGGDVLGVGFVAGPGGSFDMSQNFPYLSTTPGTRNPFFALVPSRGTSASAYDSQIYADLTLDAGLAQSSNATFQMGQTITIGAGAAIPAGTYTILPPRYALLPGAVAVEAAAGYLDMSPTTSVAMPDGTAIVAGKLGYAASGTLASRWSGYRVYSGSQFRTLSEFHDYLGSQFFAAAANEAAQATPRLSTDAGSLDLYAGSTIVLGATLDTAPELGGRGADIALDAPSLEITAGTAPATAAPSSLLSVTAASLSALGAETLVLGAQERRTGASVTLSQTASALSVDAGASLAAGEVILTGKTVSVGAGASVSALASQKPNTTAGNVVGDGAALYVGNVGTAPTWTHSAASPAGTATVGDLLIADQATISGKSVVFDATRSQSYSPSFTLQASNVTLSAALVDLGNAPQGTPGLVLDPTLLSRFGAAGTLSIDSFGGIDVFGAVTLGSLDSTGKPTLQALNLVTPAILGQDSAAGLTITAGHIGLDNSLGLAASNHGSSTGQLTLNAIAGSGSDGSIDVRGTLSFGGFAGGTNLLATGIQQSATQSATGTGELRFSGAAGSTAGIQLLDSGAGLAIDSTRVTTNRGVNAQLLANGEVSVGASGPAQSAQTRELGGSLSIAGTSVDISGRIDLPAGVISITANGAGAADGITLDSGSELRVAGVTQTFATTSADASAGSISLSTLNGGVLQSSGATIDLQGAGTKGNAGTLAVSAASGTVQLDGQLLAVAPTSARGANISIDAGQLGNFSALAGQINAAGGANGLNAVDLRARSGDITVASADTLHARQITLEADGGAGASDGSISVLGTLDARGVSGGKVSLYANNSTSFGQGSRVLASATDAAGNGGQIYVSSRVTADTTAPTSLDAITVGSGSTLDVSGGAAGNGGLVTLRANAVNPGAANADLAIAPIAGAVLGAREVVVEGVTVVKTTGDVILDGSATDPLANAAPALQTYMASMASNNVAGRLDPGATLPLSLRPGIEIQATGNLTVASPYDFAVGPADGSAPTFTWRYGGQTLASSVPGELTLRAGGNLAINAFMSDGFQTGYDINDLAGTLPNSALWNSGESWSFTFTAGADLRASSANRVGLAPADLTIGNPTLVDPNTGLPLVVTVRTGTGSIALNASRDVVLRNGTGQQANVVYTAGVADIASVDLNNPLPAMNLIVPDVYGDTNPTVIVPTIAHNGGDLSISAGRDVLGTDGNSNLQGSTQNVNEWLMRGGLDTSASPTVWWVYPLWFQQGFGALGGGNLAIEAGRDVVRVGAVVPSEAVASGSSFTQWNTGSLSVDAGRSIVQGLFYDQAGSFQLTATSLQSNPAVGGIAGSIRLEQGSNTVSIQARESLVVATPVNPTAMAPSDLNVSNITQASYSTAFYTYSVPGSAEAGVDFRSAAGDITLATPNTGGSAYTAMAPNLAITSFGGSIIGQGSGSTLYLTPAADGQFSMLADAGINGIYVWMSQADPSLLPAINRTVTWNPAFKVHPDLEKILDGTLTSAVPLHGSDSTIAEMVARTGSIVNVGLTLPKTTEIYAGNNIGPQVNINIQNANADSLSIVSAGNQINFANDNSIIDHIFFRGQGAGEVLSGSSMNLGTDGQGIESRGNLDNGNLPALGASLLVAAGTGKSATGFAATPDYLGLIEKFVQYDAFASAGASSAVFNQQVLSALAADPALADLSAVLTTALANRSDTAGLATALRALTPEKIATGAVRLATAIQAVSNKQFVASANQDTFAPAYVAFQDLFPQLDANAAAIEQFVLNNPFAKAPNAAQLQQDALNGLPAPLAAAINLGLSAPGTLTTAGSAFSTALAAIDPASLATGARQLLANTLTVAGNSVDALRASGKLTGSGSPYAKELTAFAAAFTPTTTAGLNDIQMAYNDIKANQTGDVAIFAPQGSVIVGQSAAPSLDAYAARKTAADLGIFTYGGGDIIGMVRDNFDVYRSRVFTVAGGDINLWSSLGNIDAGRGARDVAVAPPPRVVVDPATGIEYLDFGAAVVGSGIGALKTQVDQAPSNINLMAPAGYVDAGEAGIRAESGSVTLGTNLVLNAGNIQAASGVSGGAVVAAPAPPPPPSTGTSSADRTLEASQRDAIAQQQAADQRASEQRRMRVMGEFLAFDNACGTGTPVDPDTAAECAARDADKAPAK